MKILSYFLHTRQAEADHDKADGNFMLGTTNSVPIVKYHLHVRFTVSRDYNF